MNRSRSDKIYFRIRIIFFFILIYFYYLRKIKRAMYF